MRNFRDIVVIPTPTRPDNPWANDCLRSIEGTGAHKLDLKFYLVLNDPDVVDLVDLGYLQDLYLSAFPWLRVRVNATDSRFELGALRCVMDESFDRVMILQDSFVIKDSSFFKDMFDQPGSVSLNNQMQMYAVVYMKSILDDMGIPFVGSKQESVKLEGTFNHQYRDTYNRIYTQSMRGVYGQLTDSGNVEARHGRQNNLVHNEKFVKYKGTWKNTMIGQDNRGA